jgi:YD repeat-containing protein
MRKKNPATRILLSVLVGLGILPAHALQGGPIMPEYVQFEPADAPDMVNLNTGDFSYTLPLSEVPGPYGGYPISMSYHAGIGPNQEATMVGLGWSLNAGGAINRNLRGAPDDQSHGGDLAFVYAFSSTTVIDVDVSVPIYIFGINMKYNSYCGYGFNASVGFNYGIAKIGVGFGTDGVSLRAGVYGKNGVGVSGNIGITAAGYAAGIGPGFTAMDENGKGSTITSSIGVHVHNGKVSAAHAGFGYAAFKDYGESAIGDVYASAGTHGASVSASYHEIGGSVNLSSRGYSASVSVGSGVGLGVEAASDTRSSSDDHSASIAIPGFFTYSRTIYESWVRQATSEHTYGYMYQAGPAIAVDGPSEDVATTASTGTGGGSAAGSGQIPWNWNFKGRSLDHVGNPSQGHLFPGYDVFEVASQGVGGAFRAIGLSKHEMLMSVEQLGGVNAGDKAESDAQNPNPLFYLLREDNSAVNPNKRHQLVADFNLTSETSAAAQFTRYAYDYCFDKTESDSLNVHFLGTLADSAKFNLAKGGFCSRYAVLKSNHLNEANRLLFSRNPYTNLDLNKKFRSRMVFAFMGENGGYFEPEDYSGSTKKARGDLAAFMMRRRIANWKNSPYSSATPSWDEPITSVRRIEPILEDNSNIGRLKGFKITNPDGTQYFFTQPVRSLLTASYTTNKSMGSPAFIDRTDPRRNEDWGDLLKDAWGHWQDHPVSSIVDNIGKLVKGSISSFLFNSPNFKDKCDDLDTTHTSTYNFSYTMSTNPYATQWLLSEIRGADFVEFDKNNMKKNYGYQVKFNYTEPAHYAWRVPFAPPGVSNDSLPNLRLAKNGLTPENCASELYHASFGVKELVYLHSIETSTHKAVFHLNDIDANPRIDGKGWVFNWRGDYKRVPNPQAGQPNQRDSIDQKVREGIPIIVGTHFPIKKVVDSTHPTDQSARLFLHDKKRAGSDTLHLVSQLNWKRYPVSYTIGSVFLDVQPTIEQVRNMKRDRRIVVTGMSRITTNAIIKFKAPNFTPDPLDPGYKPGYEFHSSQNPSSSDTLSVIPGYDVPALAPDFGYSLEGKSFTALVDTIVRSHGDELQFGSYKIIFQTPVAITGGTLDGGFQFNPAITDSLYLSNFDTHSPGIPAMDTSVALKLTSGGGDFHGLANQPLLVFNDFVDFNKERGYNQMRFLTHIDLVDKETPDSPYKRFAFSYKNDIQPMTLNSYAFVDGDTSDPIARHRRSYPTNPNLDNSSQDPAKPDTVLQGKLKLESVTELACSGVDCAQNMSIPSYRFYYQNPSATPFSYHGGDRTETIRSTTEKEDEWGYYNPRGGNGNFKTKQYLADYGGAVWSLNKIVDPSGGITEMTYERDTYYGEDYSDNNMAIGMRWGPCNNDSTKVCLYFLPKRWEVYCDRHDELQGDWVFTHQGAQQDMEYVKKKGFVPGVEMFFNLQQVLVTEVGCGLNLGFWKAGGCERHRSVSVVGSAKIKDVSLVTGIQAPLYDVAAYEKDKADGNLPPTHHGPDSCVVPVWVGNRTDGSGHYVQQTLDAYWHCNYSAYRIETDLSLDSLKKQFVKTAEKLVDRTWEIDNFRSNEQFGVAWARQSNLALKGGDIRVRRLTKRDIGLVQRTEYEYGIGQMAQYPDSVFSTGFATRFSTGKITEILGTGMSKDYFKPYHNFPSRSRIPGIGDEDIFLLPGPGITYPKVTVTNIIERDDKKIILNGKTEFEFHTPEQIGYLDMRISPFHVAANDFPRNIFIDYFDASGNKIFARERFDVKSLDNKPYTQPKDYIYQLVRRDLPDPADFKAKQIKKIRLFYDNATTDGLDDSLDITLSQPTTSPYPRVELYLKGGSLGGLTIQKDIQRGDNGEIHQGLDFPTQILTKKEVGDSTLYSDYTSRIGKAKSTTFYRWIPDSAANHPDKPGHYALIKRDSMAYSSVAPSVDRRFIADADTGRVGRFKEVWSYNRIRKCDSTATDSSIVDCKDNDAGSQWAVYKDAPRHRTVSVTRYPTFLIKTKSISGFNDSRQQDDPALAGGTDFLVTTVTNHFFDPVTGQPTVSVAHAGPNANSPVKITRTTPAYISDSGQQVTDIPMLIFAKNVLEPNFRQDAFTFRDSNTVSDFDSPTLFSGANAENGGALASHLTTVKISPFRQKFLSLQNGLPNLTEDTLGQAQVTQPIATLGSFAPRFLLSQAADSIPANRALFALQPNLKSWQGSKVAKVNRFLKVIESKDAYGRSSSNRFDPRGLHQIGLFGNAPYSETAVLTADGYFGGAQFGDWTFTNALPVKENGFLNFTSPFDFRHPFDLDSASSYVVECQVYATDATDLTFKFEDNTGAIWGANIVHANQGLGFYRVTIDNALWRYFPPARGTCRLWVRSSVAGNKVGFKFIRAYPKKAEAITYVYDERGNMLQNVDVTGISTYFEYDLFGKLIAIRNDDGVMLTAGSRERTNR